MNRRKVQIKQIAEPLWSVRMRASRKVKSRKSGAGNNKTTEIHISGAEGLYGEKEIRKVVRDYSSRALDHPRGVPDEIVITIEKIYEKPLVVPLLPVATVKCNSPGEGQRIIEKLLSASGISKKAITGGIRVMNGKVMRGASLIRCRSGVRVEPDRARGIRVSRLGIEEASEGRLSRRLSRKGINTPTVKEALVLASKVASCKGVVAELCMSDDPGYTTGYVASANLGYVRIPNIKERGSLSGGRVFFIEEGADTEGIIAYLEKRPVTAYSGPKRYRNLEKP